tara:strand:- start:59 stop:1036 length:978 start_codon:yes stop_codon:yes gene_type:complete
MLLDYSDFINNAEDNVYKMADLRRIIKEYNIKTRCRKKTDAIEVIYVYLKESYHAIKIQRVFRGFLHRSLLRLKGDGWRNLECCVNDTDFYTLDVLKDIPAYEFFSFKDGEQVYGANIVSLFKLLRQTDGKPEFSNPYNRNKLTRTALANSINCYIRISGILKIPIDFYPETSEIYMQEQTDDQIIAQRISNVFIAMDELGNYTQESWFLDVTPFNLVIFINRLRDIWDYRAQLTFEVKRRISNNKNIFRNIDFSLLNQSSVSYYNDDNSRRIIRKLALDVIERFVYSAVNTEDRSLGTIFVLTALTIVSPEAAAALPWLYDSVS